MSFGRFRLDCSERLLSLASRLPKSYVFACAAKPPLLWSVALSSTRKGVQNHGQVHELRFQPDVGNVGHPQLVDAAERHLRRPVRING